MMRDAAFDKFCRELGAEIERQTGTAWALAGDSKPEEDRPGWWEDLVEEPRPTLGGIQPRIVLHYDGHKERVKASASFLPGFNKHLPYKWEHGEAGFALDRPVDQVARRILSVTYPAAVSLAVELDRRVKTENHGKQVVETVRREIYDTGAPAISWEKMSDDGLTLTVELGRYDSTPVMAKIEVQHYGGDEPPRCKVTVDPMPVAFLLDLVRIIREVNMANSEQSREVAELNSANAGAVA